MQFRRLFRHLCLMFGLVVVALVFVAQTTRNWASEPAPYTPASSARAALADGLGDQGVSVDPGGIAPLRMTNLINRPIFHPDRRPYRPEVKVAVKAKAEPVKPRLDEVSVQGILISEDIKTAKVVTKKHPEGVWLALDGKVDGYVVEKIESDSVTIRSGAEKRKIKIALRGAELD